MSQLDDERVARLQRAAYGADVSDAERSVAERELAALRNRLDIDPPLAIEGATTTPTPLDARASVSADPGASAPSARAWLIAASAFALVAGIGIGVSLDAIADLSESARTVPAVQTEAWRVFQLPALNGHPARFPVPDADLDLDLESRRVLASRWDGVRVIAVRTIDGEDGCLVLIVPLGPPATACTTDGRFPVDGLTALTEARGAGVYSATWEVTGRVSLAPAIPAE